MRVPLPLSFRTLGMLVRSTIGIIGFLSGVDEPGLAEFKRSNCLVLSVTGLGTLFFPSSSYQVRVALG